MPASVISGSSYEGGSEDGSSISGSSTDTRKYAYSWNLLKKEFFNVFHRFQISIPWLILIVTIIERMQLLTFPAVEILNYWSISDGYLNWILEIQRFGLTRLGYTEKVVVLFIQIGYLLVLSLLLYTEIRAMNSFSVGNKRSIFFISLSAQLLPILYIPLVQLNAQFALCSSAKLLKDGVDCWTSYNIVYMVFGITLIILWSFLLIISALFFYPWLPKESPKLTLINPRYVHNQIFLNDSLYQLFLTFNFWKNSILFDQSTLSSDPHSPYRWNYLRNPVISLLLPNSFLDYLFPPVLRTDHKSHKRSHLFFRIYL
jgi:hypothetical protein